MIFYHFGELIILFALIIRILYYSRKDFNKLKINTEVYVYILILFLNNIICSIIDNVPLLFESYNAIVPSLLVVLLILDRFKHFFIKFCISILISFLFFYLNNSIFNLILYIAAILLMLRKAFYFTKNSSINLHRSSLYIIFSIDLLFSILNMQLGNIDLEWNQSKLINYLGTLSAVVFFINLILTHVFIRRFFVA